MDAEAALRRIAFELERDGAPTYRVQAFRRAAAVLAAMPAAELARRIADGTPQDLRGIGPATAAVIAQAAAGERPDYLVRLEAAYQPPPRTAMRARRCAATAIRTRPGRSVTFLNMNRTLLAPLRLSHYKDSSVNPAGQRARIAEYAEDNDDHVIFVDVDMDVSGAVPIRQRPGLGPWLAPDRIGQINGFLADEMDRLSRDMLDYLQFARDMATLGKVIIDVSDGTDTSTERGRQQLEDRILAAQRERERMAARRRKAAKRLADEGRFGGGKPGYGYAARCLCHNERRCPEPPDRQKGWTRVQDSMEGATAKWMVQQRIAGRGFSAIAAELNTQGIPAPRGGKWNATTVRKILTSPQLLGHVVVMIGEQGVKGMSSYKKGHIVATRRGRDGQPVKFTDEPLIDQDTWDQLQEAIKAGSKARGQAQSRHMLYRVLFCRACSTEPFNPETAILMYGSRRNTTWQKPGNQRVGSVQSRDEGGQFIPEDPASIPQRPYARVAHSAYYTCKSCGLNIRLDRIEPLIEAFVLQKAGNRVLLEKHIVHGDDHAAEISRLERAAEKRRMLLDDEPDDEDLQRSLAALKAQIAEAKSKAHEPDRPEWRPVASAIKVAEHWAALDTAGRAKFLRDWEVTCLVDREGAKIGLGWLEQLYCVDAFRLIGDRLAPTALPALIRHSPDWQREPGAVLPALVAQATQDHKTE
jgi:DNA invertase Pin-like site-specific DNA recombinase